MKINKVWLDESEDECTSCGLCASIAPEVFDVPDKMVVLENVDFNEYIEEIKEAVDSCPTCVIKFEEND
jgi:ferredoxin